MITVSSLRALGVSTVLADKYVDVLNNAMKAYKINTSLRVCHFIGQLLHESGKLLYTEEIASGEAYEGNKWLGNTQPGDGKRFKGKGLIQLTGRVNFEAYGRYAGIDCVRNPDMLKQLPHSVKSACWFFCVYKKDFDGNGLLSLADENNLVRITYAINGGFNGLKDRIQLTGKLMKFYVPDSKAKMRNTYNYIKDVVDAKPLAKGMRRSLYLEVRTKSNLKDIFEGIL